MVNTEMELFMLSVEEVGITGYHMRNYEVVTHDFGYSV